MKKLIVLILSALLAVTGLTGLAAAQETDLTGTWYVSSVRQGDTEMDASMIASLGMEITLNLNEDGTAALSMNGVSMEEAAGTWDAEGNMSFGDSSAVFEIIDGKLHLTRDGAFMIFSREKPEAKQIEITPVVENPQLSDFNGTWNASEYDVMGMKLPVKLMGADVSFTLQDGTAAYTETRYDMNNNYAVTDVIEHEFTASLEEDGTLFIDFAQEPVMTWIAEDCTGFICTLHEDGIITVSIPEVDEQMEMLAAASASTENEEGEEAPAITFETEGDSEGGSSGGSSGEFSLSAFLVFEKAE